jgi:SAM-dependent MidA family methyltransferase
LNKKFIKSELRKIKKIKKNLRKGTEEYKEIKIKMKDLKHKLEEITENSPEKEKIIKEINKYKKEYMVGIIDLRKFTIEELDQHLKHLKGKRI